MLESAICISTTIDCSVLSHEDSYRLRHSNSLYKQWPYFTNRQLHTPHKYSYMCMYTWQIVYCTDKKTSDDAGHRGASLSERFSLVRTVCTCHPYLPPRVLILPVQKKSWLYCDLEHFLLFCCFAVSMHAHCDFFLYTRTVLMFNIIIEL